MSSLWRRWGWMVIAGAILIVAGTAAVVGWRAYEESVAEDRTRALNEAIRATADAEPAQAIAALSAFAEDAEPSLAALALMRAAARAVEGDDPETAAALYDAVAADPEVEQVLRDLATVLSAALSVDGTDFDALRGRLAALEAANSPWRHLVNEVMAAAAIRAGDLAAAEERLIAISDDPVAPNDLRRRAAELLAAIGAEAPGQRDGPDDDAADGSDPVEAANGASDAPDASGDSNGDGTSIDDGVVEEQEPAPEGGVEVPDEPSQ